MLVPFAAEFACFGLGEQEFLWIVGQLKVRAQKELVLRHVVNFFLLSMEMIVWAVTIVTSHIFVFG